MKCVGKNRTVTLGFSLIAGVGNSIVPNGNNAEQFLVDNVNLNKTVLKISFVLVRAIITLAKPDGNYWNI